LKEGSVGGPKEEKDRNEKRKSHEKRRGVKSRKENRILLKKVHEGGNWRCPAAKKRNLGKKKGGGVWGSF